MNFAFYNSEIGLLKIGYEYKKLKYLKVVSKIDKSNQKSDFSDRVFLEIKEYLSKKRKVFSFDIDPDTTYFQKLVLDQLLKTNYGKTTTYKKIAKAINRPKAYRAVGNAVSKNPIRIVIACHRCIRSDGKLGDYAGGIQLKKKLLDLEKST